jgi:hypothetical protein
VNLTSNHLPKEKVVVGHGALISMSTLSDSERAHVLQTLAQLATLPPEQWPTDTVHLRHRQEALYMLDATDQLRVFFRREKDGTLTIFNLAMQEALDLHVSNTPQ